MKIIMEEVKKMEAKDFFIGADLNIELKLKGRGGGGSGFSGS